MPAMGALTCREDEPASLSCHPEPAKRGEGPREGPVLVAIALEKPEKG